MGRTPKCPPESNCHVHRRVVAGYCTAARHAHRAAHHVFARRSCMMGNRSCPPRHSIARSANDQPAATHTRTQTYDSHVNEQLHERCSDTRKQQEPAYWAVSPRLHTGSDDPAIPIQMSTRRIIAPFSTSLPISLTQPGICSVDLLACPPAPFAS